MATRRRRKIRNATTISGTHGPTNHPGTHGGSLGWHLSIRCLCATKLSPCLLVFVPRVSWSFILHRTLLLRRCLLIPFSAFLGDVNDNIGTTGYGIAWGDVRNVWVRNASAFGASYVISPLSQWVDRKRFCFILVYWESAVASGTCF